MVEVPKQLHNKELNFVLLGQWDTWARYEQVDGKSKIVEKRTFTPEEYATIDQKTWKPLGKAPFEYKWQNKKYTFDSPELVKHHNNFGVIGGFGRLRILDIDDPELAKDIQKQIGDTYTVKTGSGGMHFYLYSDYYTNHVLLGERGELRADNYQVVSAPCRHPSGNYYTIINESPIKEISVEELHKILEPYLRTNLDNEIKEVISKKDQSRSGEEMSYLCKLILRGYSEKECYDKMNIFSKWSSSHQAYKDKTYDNALKFCYGVLEQRNAEKKENPEEVEKVNEENWKESLYFDKDLKQYERPKEEYLVEGMIPKSSIGIFVGYSGERKTYLTLYTALCAAAGKPVFGIMNVPKKIKIFFIDEENGKPEIDKRIKALKEGLGISNENLEIAYLSFFNAKLDNPEKQKRIISFIEQFQPDLIMVDCLQRVLGIDIDKENQKLSEFFTGFVRPIVSKYGCSWIFVHHYRKRDKTAKFVNPLDEIRGASELRNYIRFAWGVLRPGKQLEQNVDMILLKQLKMSNAPVVPDKVISFSEDGAALNVKYEGEAEDVLNTEQLAAQAIKDWIIEQGIRGEFKTGEVEAAEPGGYKKTTINGALKILYAEKFITKVKRGIWKLIAEETTKQKTLNNAKLDFNTEGESP